MLEIINLTKCREGHKGVRGMRGRVEKDENAVLVWGDTHLQKKI